MMKNVFYFVLKAFLFSRYFSFYHDIMVVLEKQHDVTTWFTNNSNTHITQYLKKVTRQRNLAN